MFKWLTDLLTKKKKKGTEIRNLKQEIRKIVSECQEAANRGDSNASIRLEAFKDKLTEQSIRLTGHKKPPSTVIKPGGLACVIVFLLALNGCGPSHNTVEEADRQGIDVQRQILLAQDVELDRIEAALHEAPDLKTASVMPIVERMREKNLDAKALTAQLIANFHPPEQPQIYSHAEVQSLVKRMLDAHRVTFWASVGAAVLAGAGAVIGLARSPIAKMIPGIGTILTSLDGTMAAIETWMTKMKAGGQSDVAAGLASVLEAAHQVPAVQKFMDKRLDLVQAGVISLQPHVEIATGLAADAAVEVQSAATA